MLMLLNLAACWKSDKVGDSGTIPAGENKNDYTPTDMVTESKYGCGFKVDGITHRPVEPCIVEKSTTPHNKKLELSKQPPRIPVNPKIKESNKKVVVQKKQEPKPTQQQQKQQQQQQPKKPKLGWKRRLDQASKKHGLTSNKNAGKNGCLEFANKNVKILAADGLPLTICKHANCKRVTNNNPLLVFYQPLSKNDAIWALSEHDGRCVLQTLDGKVAKQCKGCWLTKNYLTGVVANKAKISSSKGLWKLEKVNDKYAIKGSNNLYLRVCTKCVHTPGVNNNDYNVAVVNGKNPVGDALFKIVAVN